MVRLEYFNGKKWELVSEWPNALIAWVSLGTDTFNYRVVDENGNVLKEDTVFDKTKLPNHESI